MGMAEGRLPTALMIEACLKPLAGMGLYHYIENKGDRDSGLILLKLNNLAGQCRVLVQQRDFMTDTLVWASPLAQEVVATVEADAYSKRAIDRDPDLWVIEIEDRDMNNPFED